VQTAVLVWGDEAKANRRPQVRLTSQTSPIDPFDDPFGDRGPEFNEPSRRSFPIRTGIQPVPLADDEADSGQAPPNPFAADDSSDTLAAPANQNRSRLAPLQPTEPCDRIYNKRDCCAEGVKCQHARARVREDTIDKISLDISPSFKPDALNDLEAEQDRAMQLAQSSIRSWRNRAGEVVARGQVTDLRFGRVYIEHDGELSKIPARQLSDDDWCFLAAWWGVPTECSLGDDVYEPRMWLASTMTWKASAICHKPLYFEEVQLERYGHTAGPVLQPALSGAHFFLNIAALPYKMGINPPNECRYALGYYRPGDCAPWLLPPLPLSIRGGLMEAGAIVGGVFVIP
jgi:hypothetical protein